MNFQGRKVKRPAFLIIFAFFLLAIFAVVFPSFAGTDISILKNSVIAYNHKLHKKSLSDGSYTGEEGVLMVNPEVGRSLGLKVLMDRNYLAAKSLLKRSDDLFEDAIVALATQERERFPGEHVTKVANLAVSRNKLLLSARKHLADYKAVLNSKNDERLQKDMCSALLEDVLKETLSRFSNNLRDGLGHFYNICHGLKPKKGPLSSENIRFVNYVFNGFMKKASLKKINRYDLDRVYEVSTGDLFSAWNYALGRAGSRYIGILHPILDKQKGSGYPVDLMLFSALIKQESGFNPRAVSQVGAVGLTQIMPQTAKGLGMKSIFMPSYFNDAGTFMGRERSLRNNAIRLLSVINEENKLKYARRARELMKKSLKFKKRRTELFARYKRELLKNGTDDRLDPRKAIKYGAKYFASMMKMQKGDISLALASYNAGPHRIKQYEGIPPYDETVSFRNGVLRYYKDYMRRLDRYRTSR